MMDSTLRDTIAHLNVDAWGVADIRSLMDAHPNLCDALHRPLRYAVVLGKRLLDEVVEGIKDRPTPLYFHNYRQVNYFLDRAAFEVAALLQKEGYASIAVPASQQISREPPTRGHISHVLLGWQAGIGWLGRNRLLVHPRYGQRMRYVSILTDAPLSCGSPMEADCGACMACVKACPAGAIKEEPGEFDIMACYSKLEEFRKLPFIGQHICGLCIKACSGKRQDSGCCASRVGTLSDIRSYHFTGRWRKFRGFQTEQ